MDAHRVIEEATATLDGVDHALVRLSDGSYRTCESCGGAIEDDVLERDPTARLCAAHAAG
jgi:RNA polymerase-binding transcription factor DksA